MDQQPDHSTTPIGVYDRSEASAFERPNVVAIVVCVVWVVVSIGLVIWASGQEDTTALRWLLSVLVVVLPVGLIWVAMSARHASRIMSEESKRLNGAVDSLRKSYVSQAQAGRSEQLPSISRKLEEIAAAQKKTEAAMTVFSSTRTPLPDEAPTLQAGQQTTMDLETPEAEVAPNPLTYDDFIRALNFPKTAEDVEGFAALRRALKDRQVGLLVRASQDVLTLLSQDGVYMDDLHPDLAKPEIWRKFAGGARGRTIATLGGVQDRSSLALTAARMKKDPIFRDAGHHFLRLFDQTFSKFEAEASDAEITEFAGTRTARAFMLLGRVAGTFD